MKKRDFKKLREEERKAKLLSVLVKKTDGKIEKEVLEKLVNNSDPTIQYKILVLDDPKLLSKESTLIYNSKTVDNTVEMEIESIDYEILGDIRFGTKKGNYLYLPYFDIQQDIIFIKKKIKSRISTPPKGTDYNTEEYIIVIYLGDNDYKVSNEVQYILDNFNIK